MPIHICLEKVRSAYNVGSVFRSCDSAGIDKLYLTGWTATPLHPKVVKTALGSTNTVQWEHHCEALPVLQRLKDEGFFIACMEPIPGARDLFSEQLPEKTCLVFGNEIDGISAELLTLADGIFELPHEGLKTSLNIAVAAGITLYEVRRKRKYR